MPEVEEINKKNEYPFDFLKVKDEENIYSTLN
jgi:hypothetical protein